MRPIDADAVVERLQRRSDMFHFDKRYVEAIRDAIGEVLTAPALDVVPVVHAYWIYCENGGYFCSACDHRVAFLVHNRFCPNCGARMDGEAD